MLKEAKRVEKLYEDMKKVEGMPRDALKHLWDAALVLRAKHHPDHLEVEPPKQAEPKEGRERVTA